MTTHKLVRQLISCTVILGLAIALLPFDTVLAGFRYADLAGNIAAGDNYSGWDLKFLSWTNGDQKGYDESWVVPLYVPYEGLNVGDQREFIVCFEYHEQAPSKDSYAFIKLLPYNTTVQPDLRDGPIVYTNDGVASDKAQIDYVDLLPMNDALCGGASGGNDILGYRIAFTVMAAGNGFIYFGGQLAAAGLVTAYNTVVPAGHGAASWHSGVFQSFLKEVTGDRKVQWAASSILLNSADLQVVKQCPDFNLPSPFPYTITVTNLGPGSAFGVSLTDTLPNRVVYQSFTSVQTTNGDSYIPVGTNCTASGQIVSCVLGTGNALLNTVTDPTSKWVVTIYVTLLPGPAESLQNDVTVTAFTPDPVSANNSSFCRSTTPVSLAFVQGVHDGDKVHFDWSTATEVGNLGFNLYWEGKDGRQRINPDLIRSHVITSVDPQDYSYEAAGAAGDRFSVEEVSVNGESRFYGPFELGPASGARPEVDPIDWTAIGAAHEACVTGASGTAGVQSVLPKVDLLVDRDGLYRVTYERLRNAGFDFTGVSAGKLALTNGGQPVPIQVKSTSTFGPGAYIEFYGQALDTLYTQTNVYTLQVDRTLAIRIPADSTAPPRGVPAVPYYMETATVERPQVYDQLSPNGDPWYDTNMGSVGTYSFDVAVDGYVEGAAAATLTLDMYGITDWDVDPDHHLIATFNGTTVGDVVFDGHVVQTVSVELPAGLLHEGSNSLQIAVPGVEGEPWDNIAMHSYAVTYPRAFAPRNGSLTFVASGSVFTVKGLPNKNVVVYRLNGTIQRLTKVSIRGVAGAYTATFAGSPGPATYLVSATNALPAPGMHALQPYADITSGTAGYLIISNPDFVSGLQPLVDARQGLDPRVVNVQDIYAQFGYGVFGADAIRDYIAYAIANMNTQYVLLVGGDTYDYMNYLRQGSISFIPSLYAETGAYMTFSPVDPLYTDVNGDRIPERPIGRLPVRTLQQLQALVGKTLAYANKGYGLTAVLAADGGFMSDADTIAAQLPLGWTAQRAYLDELGVRGAKSVLLNAINAGVALTNFVGHSGPTRWTFDGLFSVSDAAGLLNSGRPTVVTAWGCWNAYYVAPTYNSITDRLLLSGDQGAAAVLGATSLAYNSSERELGMLLTPRLLEPGVTIGAALQAAKAELAAGRPDMVDVLLGWTILGDPALVVQAAP